MGAHGSCCHQLSIKAEEKLSKATACKELALNLINKGFIVKCNCHTCSSFTSVWPREMNCSINKVNILQCIFNNLASKVISPYQFSH